MADKLLARRNRRIGIDSVLVEKTGHVALVRLNRPEVRNAISPEMAVALADLWQELRDDAGVRVIVVTGTGSAFCAGADLGKLIPLMSGEKTPASSCPKAFMSPMFLSTRRSVGHKRTVAVCIDGRGPTYTTIWPTRTTSLRHICNCTTNIAQLRLLRSCSGLGLKRGKRAA